ncbi:MAG: 50S ribosomal protein L11 methyltransferase [Bacteroidales bacterium]
MNYLEFQFKMTPCDEVHSDILSAQLGEIGFESFVTTQDGVDAYIQVNLFDEEALRNIISDFPLDCTINYTYAEVIAQNWNEEWEKHYFNPIIIEGRCVIHSSFHKEIPNVEYDILIDPKMSFGTGHHETTSLMLTHLLDSELNGSHFLDMGCGTAVLAILASKKGAKDITAIDIDEWATENAIENCRLNNTNNIKVLHGDASLLKDESMFDTIFANINRNILLDDMHNYTAKLIKGGALFMSGFYKEDLQIIEEKANPLGLKLDNFKEKNNWVAAKFILN